jgi:hypothetical protein
MNRMDVKINVKSIVQLLKECGEAVGCGRRRRKES